MAIFNDAFDVATWTIQDNAIVVMADGVTFNADTIVWGTSGISITSISGGTWDLIVDEAYPRITGVDIEDCDASGGSPIIAAHQSNTDSGGNTNILFAHEPVGINNANMPVATMDGEGVLTPIVPPANLDGEGELGEGASAIPSESNGSGLVTHLGSGALELTEDASISGIGFYNFDESTVYYVGNSGSPGAWGNKSYWSYFSGGAGGAKLPEDALFVYFDANSPDCTIETGLNPPFIGNLYTNNYTGTLDFNDNNFESADTTNLVSGTFNLGTGTLKFYGSAGGVDLNGSTINCETSTVEFKDLVAVGNHTWYNLVFKSSGLFSGGGGSFTYSGTMTVDGTVEAEGGGEIKWTGGGTATPLVINSGSLFAYTGSLVHAVAYKLRPSSDATVTFPALDFSGDNIGMYIDAYNDETAYNMTVTQAGDLVNLNGENSSSGCSLRVGHTNVAKSTTWDMATYYIYAIDGSIEVGEGSGGGQIDAGDASSIVIEGVNLESKKIKVFSNGLFTAPTASGYATIYFLQAAGIEVDGTWVKGAGEIAIAAGNDDAALKCSGNNLGNINLHGGDTYLSDKLIVDDITSSGGGGYLYTNNNDIDTISISVEFGSGGTSTITTTTGNIGIGGYTNEANWIINNSSTAINLEPIDDSRSLYTLHITGTGKVSILRSLDILSFSDGFTIDPGGNVQFQSGKSYEFYSTSWVGTPGNLITLTASTPGVPWDLGLFTDYTRVYYVDAKDSNITNSVPDRGVYAMHYSNVDSGGNTDWYFSSIPTGIEEAGTPIATISGEGVLAIESQFGAGELGWQPVGSRIPATISGSGIVTHIGSGELGWQPVLSRIPATISGEGVAETFITGQDGTFSPIRFEEATLDPLSTGIVTHLGEDGDVSPIELEESTISGEAAVFTGIVGRDGTLSPIPFEESTTTGFGTSYAAKYPYYSVGQNLDDHKTGSPTITISNSVIMFSVPQTSDYLGAGDVINLLGGGRLFLRKRVDSNKQWTVGDNLGRVVADITTPIEVTSIKHCFMSLEACLGSAATGGTAPNPNGIIHADFAETHDFVSYKIIPTIFLYRDSGNGHDDNTSTVLIRGFLTDDIFNIRTFAPGINTSGILDADSETDYSNVPQHTTTGLADEGWVFQSSASIGVDLYNVNLEFINWDLMGSSTTGIRVRTDAFQLDYRVGVKGCIIRNTGQYGVRWVESGTGLIENAVGQDNIFYNQTVASMWFENVEAALSSNSTYYRNGGGVAIKADTYTRLDIGYDCVLGDGGVTDDYDISGSITLFGYCRGESSIFSPGIGSDDRTNRIITQTEDNYADLVVDAAGFDFNPSNINSELARAAIRDYSFSPGLSFEVSRYDTSGRRRNGPLITIGALELPVIFEFTGRDIQRVLQHKLKYIPFGPNSDHTDGEYVSDQDLIQYLRPPSTLTTTDERYAFATESKVIIQLKEIVLDSFLDTDKDISIVQVLTAYFDFTTNSIIVVKPRNFAAGLLLKLIGDKQYIFKFNEQTASLTIGTFGAKEVALSGPANIVNKIKFGGSPVLG